MRLDTAMTAAEGWIEAARKMISAEFLRVRRDADTRPMRVPEQADASNVDDGYEVSSKLSRPMDLQRICCRVSLSITAIAPPQCGQSQAQGSLGSEAVGMVERWSGQAFSKRWQRGSDSPRRRLARKPQERMRTKPRGKI